MSSYKVGGIQFKIRQSEQVTLYLNTEVSQWNDKDLMP